MRNVARDDGEIDSPIDFSTLTSGISVAWEMVGSRMARRRMSKRGNIEPVGISAANAAIVRPNVATTEGLVGAFDFSTLRCLSQGNIYCARSSLILLGSAREGTPSTKDASLSCTVSTAGTCVKDMGSVEREEIGEIQ